MSRVPDNESVLELANIRVNDLSFEQITEKAVETIAAKAGPLFIVTLDILGAYKSIFDAEYHKCLTECDIVTCDGSGLKMLSFLKYPRHIKNKVSGIDLAERLLKEADKNKYRAAFIGAREETIKQLEKIIKIDHPDIAGTYFHDGYFDNRRLSSIIEKLVEFNPDIIFIGLGNPVQEKLINKIRHLFQGSVMMGVGGSFDVMSGRLKRAPAFMRKIYLEWLYRLWQEPGRIFRMLNIPKYIIYVLVYEALKWNTHRSEAKYSKN